MFFGPSRTTTWRASCRDSPLRVTRWQKHKRRVGYGHLYQGRYKSFPVESDDYFYQVVRYVDRNALRANLVQQADAWKWSSLWRYYLGNAEQKNSCRIGRSLVREIGGSVCKRHSPILSRRRFTAASFEEGRLARMNGPNLPRKR